MRDRGGYRHSPYLERFSPFPRMCTTVRALLIANAAVFVVQFLAYHLSSPPRVDLAEYLGIRADRVVERLWAWQVFTYMFLHSVGTIWHIVFNMLILFMFGTEVERLYGRRRFLTLYLGGGAAGGLAYCVTQYLVGSRIPAVGASAAVMAVMVVYAIHFPNRLILLFFFIPIRVKWAVLLLVGIDLLGSIGSYADGVAHTAHLGGAAFAFLSWKLGPALAQFFARMEDRHREREAKRLVDDEQRMDDLLAKITREGFDSLTPRERKFLNEMSRRRRDRGYRG